MDIPSIDTLKHILDRLKANDVAWFKDKFKAGDFAWLKDRLPEGGYTKLGEKIEAGDLGHVREVFSGLDLPGVGGLFGGAKAAAGAVGAAGAVAAGAGAKAAAKGGAALKGASGVVINDDKRKKGAVWLLPVALLAALGLGFGLSRCGKSDSDDTTAVAVADTTAAAAAVETTAAATETTATTATAAAETTAAAAAAETTAAAAAATGDILDTATKAGSFNTLGAAITAAGLTDTLKGAGPFTVFAPTDDAFKALPAGLVDALLKPENKDTLTKVLTYHVVPGTVMAADLTSGDVATVEGATVKVDVTDGKVKVNNANVTAADVSASNGVIHVIDQVLVPSDIDVTKLLGAGSAAAETTVAVDLTTTNKAGDATPEDLTVYFDSGSAAFNAAAQAKIDAAVTILGSLPAGSKVALVGRADKTGNAAANLALSKRRAEAVQAALVKGLADKASNIAFTADAKGDAEQIEDLTSARRVTIEIAK